MFADLFRERMHLRRFVSVTARGDEVHATAEAHACRYEPSTRLLRNAGGSQSVSEAVLYTATAADPRDLVFPPGADPADPNQARRPLRVENHRDPDSGRFAYAAIHI